MKSQRERALVLRLVPYRERDLIVHFLGEESGPFGALVYGAKKAQEGFSYQPGDLLELDYLSQEGKDLVKIEQASPMQLIQTDRFSYDRFLVHTYLLELIQRALPPDEAAPGVFDLLRQLSGWSWPPAAERGFLLWFLERLARELGFAADWGRCSNCGKETFRFEGERWRLRKQSYTIEAVGLVCSQCTGRAGAFGADAVKLLLLAQESDFLERVETLPTDLLGRVALSLNRRLLDALELRPKSLALLERFLLA